MSRSSSLNVVQHKKKFTEINANLEFPIIVRYIDNQLNDCGMLRCICVMYEFIGEIL